VKVAEIRQRFLSFFADRDHEVVPSAPLVPYNDPTLFFINAGMVQFKDVFTGKEQRDYRRAASVQKCLRVSGKHNDLEHVGRTPRHHTFFEMLGNFSFGDYFKADAIPMAWELLTGDLGMDPNRLWVTVFEDDDEAYDLWLQLGFPEARLQRMDAKENFWSMGDIGPCGPCSELHYDHGPAISADERGPAFGSDRYVEIWNLVFMQFEQSVTGRTLLPNPSIDTGAGLERIAAVMQGVYSNYDTDIFQPLIAKGSEISGVEYGRDAESDVALRVIADHARATAFLVSDGIMPANEGRGYVLRRLMRRAIRFGVKLGVERPFFHEITATVARQFRESYPEVDARYGFVEEVVRGEEDRFRRTLDRGMKLLEGELERAGKGGVLPGEVAFTLSDTYGFPLDLTRLIVEEQGASVDEPGFEAALEEQRARGRAAWKGSGERAVADLWFHLAVEHGPTHFTGYTEDESAGTVVGLVKRTEGEDGAPDYEVVERLETGQTGFVIMDRSPFYAEAGGQVGDRGELRGAESAFRVTDTLSAEKLHVHRGKVTTGTVSVGDGLQAVVDAERRSHTRRNHTATHLMHAALRQVLGDHVAQKGSLVAPDRLRFDFSHHKPMTEEEVHLVEDLVNEEVLRNVALKTSIEDLESAKSTGAMALFGEKYDEQVRVVRIPGFSVELCGGTHCRRTGDIGPFHITSESGIAAGVRRIEAQTGAGAHRWVRSHLDTLKGTAAQLRTSPDNVLPSLQRLREERKKLERELESARRELAKRAAGDLLSQARDIDGVQVLAAEFDGDLREQADRLRDQLGTALVVLVARRGEKVQLLAAATKDIAGSRVHAGKVIQEIAPLVGGRGGGRPDMAQGGGVDTAGISAALARAYDVAGAQLGGA
jgi:alanyl-tRNA synthetase